MSREQILAAIPHRPPMLLLDEVVAWEESRIVCRKTFQPDEWFFQGHYPDFPLVPGVLLVRSGHAGRRGAAEQAFATRDGVPVAGRLNDVKFKRMVRPGDTVQIESRLDERMGDAFFLSGKGDVRRQAGCAR